MATLTAIDRIYRLSLLPTAISGNTASSLSAADPPYHLAIGDDWKVHHFRTDMADHRWMQEEEELALLSDPTL